MQIRFPFSRGRPSSASFSSSSSPPEYVPLKAIDGPTSTNNGPSKQKGRFFAVAWLILLVGYIWLFVALYQNGRNRAGSSTIVRETVGLEPQARIFKEDQKYANRPNLTTNKAWLDLFPMQGGFFRHPKIAPERSTFSTFHQLHCLDGIRHGYWSLFDMVMQGQKMAESELPHHASAQHFMHCLDLIRNAMMCQPDLTVEVQNDKLGGVEGFGTEHSCIDWKKLVDWTSEWETYRQDEDEHRMGDYDDERYQEHGHAHNHHKRP
ncbi:hypothetical protein BU24DRAFT_114526 [Aaosphaeria arxii CBS 175.79]|uniref:Oxidase ustYa n=1 Tax=Aaosphaeria arxii CBS 175.79 TaxID=1450172 RepID=A0A6A5Y122_9PLEO|nr:uncharacterized protein BU24DRAFT_114526 [Aaosphaeria arxii CBS 175.79]KAF2019172.1 hypothetical protein BU24DRAFT_114526 [Aaosphaeria arxii CBS 175.79]